MIQLLLIALCWAAASSAWAGEVSFSKEIAPLLSKKCLTCHNAEKKKGAYELESYEALLKPGKSKLVPVEPGDPGKSELFHRITTSDPDDRMPQKDDPLSPEAIALIKGWIEQGAKYDEKDKKAPLASIVPVVYPAPPDAYSHPISVLSLAFGNKGSELLVGGYHEIMVWPAQDSRLLRRMTNIARRVHAMAWNRDQTELWAATGTPGLVGEVAIFDATGSAPKAHLCRINDELLALAFSPDGSLVAVGGADNGIHLFDAKTHQEKLAINQHADWVTALSFSPDGKRLASASRDRTARVYSTENGNLETTYTGHSAAVHAVAFLTDGKEVCSAGRDKAVHIWKAEDGKEMRKLSDFSGEIYLLLQHEDALFAACADGAVREFSIGERKLTRTLTGHGDAVFAMAGNWASKTLASAGYDGMVKLWNLESGKEIRTFSAAPQLR